MSVKYRLSKEPGEENIVYRMTEDKTGLKCDMWFRYKKQWGHHPDAYGAFAGFNSSKAISEEEAMKIVNGEN